MNRVLDHEQPQLVVLNGDLVTGENTFLENSTSYVDMIVGPLVARGLPWASAYGNHDHAYNISARGIMEREQRWPNARTRTMVPGRKAGVSNYMLPVHARDDPCGTRAPELVLWFFDSRGGVYYGEIGPDGKMVPQPGWVDASVVDWFRRTSAALTQTHGRTVPSLAFVHIPTNASLAVQTERGIHANRQPGINVDLPLARQAQGWCADGSRGCHYGGQDEPFMRAVAETPGLMALFSAHDHGASWCYRWDGLLAGIDVPGRGLNLCFGQRSGYAGYGHFMRGARQVRVESDTLRAGVFEAQTWIRLDNADVVGNVRLNATYGEDWYPATPDDHSSCPTCDYTIITPGPGSSDSPVVHRPYDF
jgi:hypothetical protein